MSGRAKKGGSFRLRMVVFSTLVAALGLVVFGLLATGFYQRELRSGLAKDLRSNLLRVAPWVLRLAEPGPDVDDRMAGRLLGRIEEIGAVYAVYSPRSGWTMSEGWPVEDEAMLRALVAELPKTSLGAFGRGRPWGDGRWPGRGPGGAEVEPETPGARVLPSAGLPQGWIYAGIAGPADAVLMAVPKHLYRPQIRRLVVVLVAVSPVSLGLVALCAWFFSSRAIAPIRKLSEVAATTTADDLSRRISGERMEREFSQLIEVFNGMLERLEKSFRQARRFGQDAAHELNTPLTILTGKVDEAIAEAPDGSPEQQLLGDIGEELGRLREIVRKLHLLARIDGGGLRPERVEVDVQALVTGVVGEMAEAFPGIFFSVGDGDAGTVSTDPALFRQILLNLLGNAARYNRPGGSVQVDCNRRNEACEFTVTNTGPAIPEALRESLFDRFTRGDAARSSEGGGGLGLGLSLSREFARILGGSLELVSAEEDKVRFSLRISCSQGA